MSLVCASAATTACLRPFVWARAPSLPSALRHAHQAPRRPRQSGSSALPATAATSEPPSKGSNADRSRKVHTTRPQKPGSTTQPGKSLQSYRSEFVSALKERPTTSVRRAELAASLESFHAQGFSDVDTNCTALRLCRYALPNDQPLPSWFFGLIAAVAPTLDQWPVRYAGTLLWTGVMLKRAGDVQRALVQRIRYQDGRIARVRQVSIFTNDEDAVRPHERERRVSMLAEAETAAHCYHSDALTHFAQAFHLAPDQLLAPYHAGRVRTLLQHVGRNMQDIDLLSRYKTYVISHGKAVNDGYFEGMAYAYYEKGSAEGVVRLLNEMREDMQRDRWFSEANMSSPKHLERGQPIITQAARVGGRRAFGAVEMVNHSSTRAKAPSRWQAHVERAGLTWGRMLQALIKLGEIGRAKELMLLAKLELPVDLYNDVVFSFAIELARHPRPGHGQGIAVDASSGPQYGDSLRQLLRDGGKEQYGRLYTGCIPLLAASDSDDDLGTLCHVYEDAQSLARHTGFTLYIKDLVLVIDRLIVAAFSASSPLSETQTLVDRMLRFHDALTTEPLQSLTDVDLNVLPHGVVLRLLTSLARVGRFSTAMRIACEWNGARDDLSAFPDTLSRRMTSFEAVETYLEAPDRFETIVQSKRATLPAFAATRQLVAWTKETFRVALGGYLRFSLDRRPYRPPARHLAVVASHLRRAGIGPDEWMRDRAREWLKDESALAGEKLGEEELIALRTLAVTEVVETFGTRILKDDVLLLADPSFDADEEMRIKTVDWPRPSTAELERRLADLDL